MATPVDHTNGVIGTLYPEDYELKGDSHFTAVTRQLLPYHLMTHDERRGLTKRSPLVKIKTAKIFGKKSIILGGGIFGKKGAKKALFSKVKKGK